MKLFDCNFLDKLIGEKLFKDLIVKDPHSYLKGMANKKAQFKNEQVFDWFLLRLICGDSSKVKFKPAQLGAEQWIPEIQNPKDFWY